MAKDKPSLYDQMKEGLSEVHTYEESFEKAKEEAQVANAAVMAAGRKSPEAARTLQQQDMSRHKANFLEAGVADATKQFEKEFLKDRGKLEALLSDGAVAKTLKQAVFQYEPVVPKGDYEEAAKLHKQIVPMLRRYDKFRNSALSKNDEDGTFSEMALDVIKDYEKNEKDPLYLRAFVELAGGAVKQEKDGKIKVVAKDGKPTIVGNSTANKAFVAERYEGIILERQKKFFELVGEDLPGYIGATLPDKYDKAKDFYSAVVSLVESAKKKK